MVLSKTNRYSMTGAFLRSALVGMMMISCGGAPSVSSSGGNSNTPGLGGSGNGSAGSNGNIGLPDPSQTPPSSSASGGTSGTAPSANNNCGVTKVNLQKQPADLLLVLDRSRSMIQDVNGRGGNNNNTADAGTAGPSKWSEVVAAIDPVIKATQGEVAWGLKLYPLMETCGVPDGATTPVATGNYNAIMTAIKAADPAVGNGGSTPTRLAVDKAVAFIKGTGSTNSKYLVVATDGQPNCAGGRNGNDDAPATIAAVAAAAAAGIPSFIVGIATAGSDAHDTLNQMAEKGGRPRTDSTKYYPVASRDELVSALETITGQIASCTFPLNPAPPVPDNVAVEIDGQRVTHDVSQANGWSYGPQNKSLILYGAVCDSLKAGTAKNVQILYGCPGVTIN
jgi:hypothetical protein